MPDDDKVLRMPWTGEFSPGQLGPDALSETLAIVASHAGNRGDIVEAIRTRWFADAASSRSDEDDRLEQQRTRSGNVLNGMQRYGLVTKEYQLSELGSRLWAAPDPATQTEQFVEHLLKHRQGLELLDAARSLHHRGERVTNDAMRSELRRRGYVVSTNSADAGKLRQWLGTAGIVTKEWDIDEARLAEVSGIHFEVVAEWQGLNKAQRAFLVTIRRLSETRGTAPIPSPELLDLVRTEHGPVFDEGQVKKIYLRLADDGWVTHTVKAGGRGGKGGTVAATDKLLSADFETLIGFRPGDLPADLRAVMTTPLDTIYESLRSPDTHTKGIALELLAVNLATDLGLAPLRLRVRGARTGGAEVDLVAEATDLHFSRWLFQCKNTTSVDVGVLAKEVGMATLLHAQVIVLATTGTVSRTVVTYARRVSETTPLQVVVVDRRMLDDYRAGGALALRQRFHQEARTAMRAKRLQVLETLDELAEDDS